MANELLNLDELQAVLEEYAVAVRNEYQDELIRTGKVAGGALLNSVEQEVTYDGNTFTVTLNLEDYWKYVENGRKPGKFPPPSAILKWIEIKPVLPRRGGIQPTKRQLAYLIGRKIAREGIEPTNALQKAKNTITEQFRERINEALGHDVENYIAKVIADENTK